MSFNELFPELFSVISGHLPLAYRPPTLFSLALTCHWIYDVIVPHLLYNDVRLIGNEAVVVSALTALTEAKAVIEENTRNLKKKNTSPSHCIHHMCIDSVSTFGVSTPNNVLDILKNLIDMDGLPNLSSLTLHIRSDWDGIVELRDMIDAFLIIPPSFWQSLKFKCPNLKNIHITHISQKAGDEWIERELLSFRKLSSVRLAGDLLDYLEPVINFVELPPTLHTLELGFLDNNRGRLVDASGPNGLISSVIPNLRTLILDYFTISNPDVTERFWRAHPGLERLELNCHDRFECSWFDGFESGMLPNLKYLKCGVVSALALIPHVSVSLVSFCLVGTYNAQGAYILRNMAPEGKLPALRSLGIHLDSGNSPKPRPGHRWREDDRGIITEADAKKPRRYFDGNYIMSIAKAAPNLEELELMGTSDDTIDSIVASLSRLPKLHHLTLSGALNGYNKPFFPRSYNWEDYAKFDTGGIKEKDYGQYAPESFEVAAWDLANGCLTLDTVTMGETIGQLLIPDGLSMRIVRERPRAEVKELRRVCAWGNMIGREEHAW